MSLLKITTKKGNFCLTIEFDKHDKPVLTYRKRETTSTCGLQTVWRRAYTSPDFFIADKGNDYIFLSKQRDLLSSLQMKYTTMLAF